MSHLKLRTALNETDYTTSLSWSEDTGRHLFHQLVDLVIDESVKCLTDLNLAFQKGNQHQVDHSMCRLRSSCLVYQSDHILETSRLIQNLFQSQSTHQLDLAVQTLTSAVDRMIQTLRIYQRAQPTQSHPHPSEPPSHAPYARLPSAQGHISPLVLVGEDLVAMKLVEFVAQHQSLDVIRFSTASAALDHLRTCNPSLVVFGLMLGEMKGLEFCRQLRATGLRSRHHLLIFTTDSRAANLNRILDVGADDFILKPITPDHLNVRLLVAQKSMAAMLQTLRLESELRRLSMQDGLTGLGNRRALERFIENQQKRHPSPDAMLQVMFIDLNDLKRINDVHGHVTGDHAIRHIASLARKQLQHQWELFRIGGDEFLAVSSSNSSQFAAQQCQSFRITLQESHLTTNAGVSLNVAASIGLASVPVQSSLEHLLHLADVQLYHAKRTKLKPLPEFSPMI
ncbi:GGDEF domain-containing response regulator [Phragmitibacter flavus]|uniref:diguanylate cyclase n=1 Tax=Phragmitibacter flavus TaxID=2576071 RepID=A0A5R8KGK7_9BACT|nr:diguanylate cyclase [Phragmitibacter flavus]TLD70729.1 GGDEF domain-containing response regulator [Phragmitibacter flavus]